MVRINKTMQAKHLESLPPYVRDFRNTACSISLPLLPQHLSTFATQWPFPRGDLYHWISLLNRFDVVLETFCKTYKLDEGPQTTEFGCVVLESSEGAEHHSKERLKELGFEEDGDRWLIESILRFSRMLLQNCGNRSIYASSSHLNNLLNSTSLSVLEETLHLSLELAQRYQAALKRMSMSSRHINTALLANHYNIELERVQQLAVPFTRTITTPPDLFQPASPATPTIKGKEKQSASGGLAGTGSVVHANDLVLIAKGESGLSPSPKGTKSSSNADASWDEWGGVKITYYPKTSIERQASTPRALQPVPNIPSTPTPVRRASNLGPGGSRSSRQPSSEDSPSPAVRSTTFPTTLEDPPASNFKVIEVSSLRLKSAGVHTVLRENISGLPANLQYELLAKLRVAKALTGTLESRRQALAVRLLAITNLAYIHPEASFIETVLKHDSEEPRRLQIVSQLVDLVHPPADGGVAVPRSLQSIAFNALAGLAEHTTKYSDVCTALSTSVNHGVLLYVVRKAVAEMNANDETDKETEADIWRCALFSLLNVISNNHRTAGELVTAGLVPILVDVLNMRTSIAERYHVPVLTFLDTILYGIRDAFQTLVNADGLDAVSNLIIHETTSAADNVHAGKGIKSEYLSAAVDYQIPYFQQQTLKWLFKCIHHMMTTAGGYGGNFDRLLRNLIDSSQLLASLRQIIGNAQCFGSIVWTNAVGILNDFINNEPTSFAVIAEAGLSQGFLEAVTNTTITLPAPAKSPENETVETSSNNAEGSSPMSDDSDDELPGSVERPTLESLESPQKDKLAKGIMPTSETINIIPQAFGAICLNSAGMRMFQASRALDSFFEIFESPEHIKCMDTNKDLPSNLGSTFDELVRHHPSLRPSIISAILVMVARVSRLCNRKAQQHKMGSKLWTTDLSGKAIVADSQISQPLARSEKGKEKSKEEAGDVEMQDADSTVPEPSQASETDLSPSSSMTPYVTAVATFMSAMFSNSSARSEFSAKGGIEYVLDLSESACLPHDFGDSNASQCLQAVVALLAESKPHLTMPSLIRRAQDAVDTLSLFTSSAGKESFFAPFINSDARRSADINLLANGTKFAKSFVYIQTLVTAINACLQGSAVYNHRSASANFNQLNLADAYIRLVESLGPLLSVSLREEVHLQKVVPEYWRNAARLKEPVFREPIADSLLGIQPPSPSIETSQLNTPVNEVPTTAATDSPSSSAARSQSETKPKFPTQSEQDTTYFKNFQTLRYALSKISLTISPFFQTLGRVLVTKRNPEPFQKQGNLAIAEALAKTIVNQLSPTGLDRSLENFSYWIGMLHVLEDMLIDVSRHGDRTTQTITIVLQAFKENEGFDVVNHVLKAFTSEIRTSSVSTDGDASQNKTEDILLLELASAGTKNILTLYSKLSNGKNVTESVQTMSMHTRERDRGRAEHFSGSHFLVELRMSVLPVVRELWESDLIEKGSSKISDKLIDVIRTIATADCENNALKRSDKVAAPVATVRKTFKPSSEGLESLEAFGFDTELAIEALYRCNNSISLATEYCREVRDAHVGNNRRYPVPEGDLATAQSTNGSRPATSASTGVESSDDQTMSSEIADDLINAPIETSFITDQTVNELLSQIVPGFEAHLTTESGTPQVSVTEQQTPVDTISTKQVTVDDLNDEREAIRSILIDRCLDVINAHGEVTFQVADLITTVIGKATDPAQQRRSIAQTLVVALLSFAGEEDLKTSGGKIAAYAHLLALLIRDKQFYTVTIAELKENESLSVLLDFVRLSPTHSPDDPSPWVSHVLLIVELLLSEDAKPRKTKWTPPKDENDKIEPPVLELVEPVVSVEVREELFEAILNILPRIGKNESLAVSVLRILVSLTRSRAFAQQMGEKKNIQRLFVMAKQLAGASSTRIQGPLMIILRHIIEDDETIKQIMRAEIKNYMEGGRHQRNLDHGNYLRAQAQLAVRNPELFVAVTNEMVKYNRWSYSSVDVPNRNNALVLKDTKPPKPSEDSVQPTVQATEDLSIQDVKVSTEGADSEMADVSKTPHVDNKFPVVENPDGVIHFLLCELLNYKDVEDKEPVVPLSPTEESTTQTNGDVSMGGTSTGSAPDNSAGNKEAKSKSSSKPEFKAEDHPIYIYRCFILQCLTELLASYNRTKIEFINFKRSAPPQAMTPSKPRSSVVNYLLFDLIPVGTLEHTDSSSLRKKLVTSNWADSVITALLSKTGEYPVSRDREPYGSENEPDLLFVRRFVLENILKAYKDASIANEPLDVKYARMLSLADLMNHIMSGKENVGAADTVVASVSQKQLRRLMFEKGFVNALTNSIAEMDLNFPGAKRAVKYILRPLKTLTSTAVLLSDLELISATPGQNEADEIESATSVSDMDSEREETPDLFRNSTLGLFESGREEDSSESDDEDEDMYEGEYGDEMEYEEEIGDDEDNISDEDEEIEGMGPIEGLSGDHGVDVEVIMEDDEGDDDEDTSEDDDDDDDEDSEDDEDDDARVEIIEEIGDIQELADDDEMGEWESEDDQDGEDEEEDYEGEAAEAEEAHIRHTLHDQEGALGQLLRSLGGSGEDAAEIMERMGAGEIDGDDEDPNGADYLEEIDEEEDDEDDEEMEDEELMFDYPVDRSGPPMGWQDDVEPPAPFHRRHRAFPPFPVFAGGSRDPLGAHRFHDPSRGHRGPGVGAPRGADDGLNPLLQRNGTSGNRDGAVRPSFSTWAQGMGGLGGPGGDIVEFAFGGRALGDGQMSAAFLEEIMRALPPLPPHMARSNFQLHVTAPFGDELPRDLQMMLGGRALRYEPRRDAAEPGSAAFFTPQSTSARWVEEAKLLFGPNYHEKANDVANAILAVLVPPAVEADKIAKAAEAERARKLKEEVEKKAEEERIAREAREAEEKAAREQKEAEEREAAEKAAAEARAARGGEEGDAEAATGSDAMDGVETQNADATATQSEETAAADRPRITTIIRGNPFDITDLGIDAEFLAELPEEIREEVIMSTVAERRSQAAAAGSQPSELDQDFLNALPDDIRAEIVAQERQERRRQQREAQSRAAAAAGNGPPPAHDMDAASILATLDPVLRNQVLLEQDEDTLAMLPDELAEQARAAMRRSGGGGAPRRYIHSGSGRRSGGPPSPGDREADIQRPARRTIVQMTDKPGIATLLRLMFIFQQGSLRSTLNSVLQNISMNRHNRNEVLTTLLHILHEGSIDVAAVERSFTHLSLKAKQPKDAQPLKTPITLKRALTNTPAGPTIQGNLEASPLLVVQQCLTCLVYLNQVNLHIPAFFLTEHDTAVGLKRTLSRKGKGKENKANKYALNTLLALLDRNLIMESSAVMESLSTLLNMITTPLQALQRKQKEAEEAAAKAKEASTEQPPAAGTSAEDQPQTEETQVETTSTTVEGAAQAASNQESGEASKEQAKPDAPKESEKKPRPLVPPVIPEHNLQLVINIFVARECSSKTFRETLSTIKNLSAIPGAKAVFGRELIAKAQALGEVILEDLNELLPQIERATDGTEIQGVALAKFSPSGSDQNKLLRVLTALDHLFDPKREKKDKPEVEADAESSSQIMEKQDLLSSLYENSTFAPMWEKLSACLSSIRQREGLLNVATILQPLIESLMVVCKNMTLKEQTLARSQVGKDLILSSPPPDSRMESLFFTFTEEHRKILNELVRHTPKLMSGTFSLLVKNPKVLEFDNKRNYFSRSIHAKAPNSRQAFPPLQLSVRRDQVFHDSFKSLYFQTGDQMKYGKLSIRFHGEEGVDAGGVTREWFQVLSRQMFDPGYALFVPVSSDRTTFHPNQLSSINEEHLMFFKFIGRIIGKALYEGRVLDCHFSRAVYKRILGKAVSIKDMESLDPDYYKSLVWMLENDITDIITETFSIDNDKFGVVETIDFIENGRHVAVTEENKHEYVRLMVEWRLTGSVKEQLDEFLKGFHEIIPAELVSIFSEQELELLISGLPEIDVDDWKSNTELHNYTASSPQIQWFWRAVRSFDKEEQAKLLQFVTGTSKVPLNGFKELEGMNGFSRFNIHRDYGNKDRLPSSHTCFNQLDLPEYESYETLRQQILTAITAGSEYFGFA